MANWTFAWAAESEAPTKHTSFLYRSIHQSKKTSQHKSRSSCLTYDAVTLSYEHLSSWPSHTVSDALQAGTQSRL